MRPDPAFARWLCEHDRKHDRDDTDPADDPGECLGECPACQRTDRQTCPGWNGGDGLSYRGEAAPVTMCHWCGKPVREDENGICAECDAEEAQADVMREEIDGR